MKKTKNFFLIVLNILVILSIVLFKKVNIIPNKYLIPIVIILVLFVLILTIINIKKNSKKIDTIYIFLLPFLIVIFFIVNVYLYSTTSFFRNITKTKEETSTFYILALKNRYSKFNDLNTKEIGIINNNDINYNIAKDKLNDLIKSENVLYDNITYLVDDLINLKIDAILINSSLFEYLDEENNYDNIIILKRIEIKIEKKIKTKK